MDIELLHALGQQAWGVRLECIAVLSFIFFFVAASKDIGVTLVWPFTKDAVRTNLLSKTLFPNIMNITSELWFVLSLVTIYLIYPQIISLWLEYTPFWALLVVSLILRPVFKVLVNNKVAKVGDVANLDKSLGLLSLNTSLSLLVPVLLGVLIAQQFVGAKFTVDGGNISFQEAIVWYGPMHVVFAGFIICLFYFQGTLVSILGAKFQIREDLYKHTIYSGSTVIKLFVVLCIWVAFAYDGFRYEIANSTQEMLPVMDTITGWVGNYIKQPALCAFPLLAIILTRYSLRAFRYDEDFTAILTSFIGAGLMITTFLVAIYPYVLTNVLSPEHSILLDKLTKCSPDFMLEIIIWASFVLLSIISIFKVVKLYR